MFSGIVEEVGIIKQIEKRTGSTAFTIIAEHVLSDISIGASIAVNGVCLTVTAFNKSEFFVEAVPETLRLTNLKMLAINSMVNLERAVMANTRIGGHFVQGHVDAVSEILSVVDDGDALTIKFSLAEKLAHYVVKKGYVTLDGMSITVVDAKKGWFSCSFIPHTQAVTVVKNYQLGQLVNLEVDILGKYVERILGAKHE